MRRWILLAALLVPLGAGHTLYWFWAVQQLRAGLAATIKVNGWGTDSGPAEAGGWPLAATLSLPNVVLHDRVWFGGLIWRSERVVLRVALASPTTLHILTHGAQRLRIGEAPEIPFTAAWVRVALPLDSRAPVSGEMAAADLHIDLPAGGGAIAIGHFEIRVAERDAALAVTLSAGAISALGLAAWLGAPIDRLELAATLTGPLPDLTAPAPPARQWRDAGGKLTITALKLGAGTFRVAGDGGLTFDDQLQPSGAGAIDVSGHGAWLDRLVAAGLLPRIGALAIKFRLSALPAAAAGEAVQVSLALRDRILVVAEIPLLQFPPLAWPGH